MLGVYVVDTLHRNPYTMGDGRGLRPRPLPSVRGTVPAVRCAPSRVGGGRGIAPPYFVQRFSFATTSPATTALTPTGFPYWRGTCLIHSTSRFASQTALRYSGNSPSYTFFQAGFASAEDREGRI